MREAKPSSGLYREALARAGARPHEAVHVGDSYVNDILGARAAGIAGVLLDRDRLHNDPLDCPRIASLVELPDLLASMGA
jgi:FMN phosphatase YigB (HAD superfamily)